MQIAVSAAGKSLDSDVDPRFGRCNGFVLFDNDAVPAGSSKRGGCGRG